MPFGPSVSGVDKTWIPLLDPESGPHSGPVIFFWRKKNIIKLGAYSENCSSYFFSAEKTLETEILFPPFGDLARSSTQDVCCRVSNQTLSFHFQYFIQCY